MIHSQLAINGGRPVRDRPFASWPTFDEDEVLAAAHVLQTGRTNYWTGQEGRLLEEEFAAFLDAEYCVALGNGALALEAALIGLKLRPGNEVVTTSRTFGPSASCVAKHAGVPVPAEVDPDTQNITPTTISQVLSPRTVGIIAEHSAGLPCDMDSILDLAAQKGLWVVEDCAQAHGATYNGRNVGTMGDVGAFSFCQNKIITTGGQGGILTTRRQDIWEAVWSFKDHGKSFAAVYHRQHPRGFRWLHESFGLNWRLAEFQAAIGRIQLRKLPLWVSLRQRNAHLLSRGLVDLAGLRVPPIPSNVEHAYYSFYAFVRPEALRPGWSRDQIILAVNAEGVPCVSGTRQDIPGRQAFFAIPTPDGMNTRSVTKTLAQTSLMFQVHPALSADDMADTIQAVTKVMRVATA